MQKSIFYLLPLLFALLTTSCSTTAETTKPKITVKQKGTIKKDVNLTPSTKEAKKICPKCKKPLDQCMCQKPTSTSPSSSNPPASSTTAKFCNKCGMPLKECACPKTNKNDNK